MEISVVLYLLSCLVSIGIATLFLPLIIELAAEKKWLDEPDHRKTHAHGISALGGIAIFFATWLPTLFAAMYSFDNTVLWLFASTLVLFAVSLADDLINLSAGKRLLVQLSLASVLYHLGFVLPIDVLLSSYLNLPILNYLATVGFVVLLINAYNFIDGIDGLAGGLGMIAALIFGVYFAYTGQFNFSILAFSLAGALFSFLQYNFNGAQIFMGDNGSTVVGLLLAAFGIQLIQTTSVENLSGLTIACSIFLIPIMDICKVTLTRISEGNSPFRADRTHIHHQLLDLGLSVAQSCYLLYGLTILIVLSVLLLNQFHASIAMAMLPIIVIGYYSMINKIKRAEKTNLPKAHFG